MPLLKSEYGRDYEYDSPVKLLNCLHHANANNNREQIVLLTQVLVSDVTVGYEDFVNTRVMAVDGVRVENLAHLVALVEGSQDRWIRLRLEYDQVLILDRASGNKVSLFLSLLARSLSLSLSLSLSMVSGRFYPLYIFICISLSLSPGRGTGGDG